MWTPIRIHVPCQTKPVAEIRGLQWFTGLNLLAQV
jgi:hypothetical protein